MQAGDVVRIDFETAARAKPGFVRPGVVVTSDDVLEFRWLTEVEIPGFGIAQAHLPTTVSVDRIIEATGTNVGPVALRQIRELIADLLGL